MTFLKRVAGAAVLAATLLLGLSPAQTGYVVTLKEQNGDVIANGIGPLDLSGLSGRGVGVVVDNSMGEMIPAL
jgi:hypothetical protein